MGAAALGLGWHHAWHFQEAVGWHGLTDWAGKPMGAKQRGRWGSCDGEAVKHSSGGEGNQKTQEE